MLGRRLRGVKFVEPMGWWLKGSSILCSPQWKLLLPFDRVLCLVLKPGMISAGEFAGVEWLDGRVETAVGFEGRLGKRYRVEMLSMHIQVGFRTELSRQYQTFELVSNYTCNWIVLSCHDKTRTTTWFCSRAKIPP
jgi:hypothetical protein